MAARGVRNLDSGEETVEEDAVAQLLRKQADKVKLQSVSLGVGLAALCLVLPVRKKKA